MKNLSNILNIKDLFREGHFDQALADIENLPISQMIYGEILKAEIFEKQGRLEYAEDIITAVLNQIDPSDIVLQFLAEVMNAGIMFKMGKYLLTKKSLMKVSLLYKNLPPAGSRELDEVVATFKRIEGNFSYFQGLYDDAIKSYEASLQIFHKLDLQADLAMIYLDLGQIQGFRGNYVSARAFYQSAFLIQQKLNHITNMAICLNKLIETNLRLGDKLSSNKYMERLEILDLDTDGDLIPLLSKFSKALILKDNRRINTKFRSQQLFREIIDEKIIDHNITMISMLNYGELLLDELKLTNEDNTAKEIGKDLVEVSKKISTIAFSLNSIPLMIEILILQSRFVAINNDFTRAEDILKQGVEIALKNNMKFLIEKVPNYSALLEREYKTWLIDYTQENRHQYDLEILDITKYLDNVKQILDIGRN